MGPSEKVDDNNNKPVYTVPVRLLEIRFTNAISCFEPGPQGHYWKKF
jgi:hypothetical protein